MHDEAIGRWSSRSRRRQGHASSAQGNARAFLPHGWTTSRQPQFVDSSPVGAAAYIEEMRVSDEGLKEILACFPAEDVPTDPTEARCAVENFLDLLAIVMRPLPLPPPDRSSIEGPECSDAPDAS